MYGLESKNKILWFIIKYKNLMGTIRTDFEKLFRDYCELKSDQTFRSWLSIWESLCTRENALQQIVNSKTYFKVALICV